MRLKKVISIYNYNNYRKYLADYYHYRKSIGKYSHRIFAREAGYNSSSFLAETISGKVNIHPDSIVKFSKALGLGKNETRYFQKLVRFNQAPSFESKKQAFEELLKHSPVAQAVYLRGFYDLYCKWHLYALRNLFGMFDFKNNYGVIKDRIYPRMTAFFIKMAMQKLLRNGFIGKNKQGYYKPTDKLVHPDPELQLFFNMCLINSMNDLAKITLFRTPRSQKEMSSFAFGIPSESFEKIRKELKDTHDRIQKIIQEEKNHDRMYQLNIQLFPLSSGEE